MDSSITKLLQWGRSLGLSKAEIADRLNITAQRLKHWENRGIPAKELFRVAALIGVPAESLHSGVADTGQNYNNTEPHARREYTRIPLLKWGQVFMHLRGEPPIRPIPEIETTTRAGRRAFAVTIRNDAMEPEFIAGSFAIVDPDIDPRPGDFVVVASDAESPDITQLVSHHGRRLLKPANPRYPITELSDQVAILGVVVAQERRYRS